MTPGPRRRRGQRTCQKVPAESRRFKFAHQLNSNGTVASSSSLMLSSAGVGPT